MQLMAYDYQTADPMLYKQLREFARHNRNHPTEAEALLNQIMGTHNIISYPDSVTEETKQSQVVTAEEDIDARLRKMRQELNE